MINKQGGEISSLEVPGNKLLGRRTRSTLTKKETHQEDPRVEKAGRCHSPSGVDLVKGVLCIRKTREGRSHDNETGCE